MNDGLELKRHAVRIYERQIGDTFLEFFAGGDGPGKSVGEEGGKAIKGFAPLPLNGGGSGIGRKKRRIAVAVTAKPAGNKPCDPGMPRKGSLFCAGQKDAAVNRSKWADHAETAP